MDIKKDKKEFIKFLQRESIEVTKEESEYDYKLVYYYSKIVALLYDVSSETGSGPSTRH